MRQSDRDPQPKMMEQIAIHLKYEGPEVQNGTMDLEDVIPVLQGFSGAFSQTAGTENLTISHRIKLSGVQQGSADIILELHQWLPDNTENIATIAGMSAFEKAFEGIAFAIVKRIFDVIRIKKHVGADTPTVHITAENSIVINNSNDATIVVPPRSYKLFENGSLDEHLEQLTKPLQEGKIDAADFKVQANNKETLSQRITSDERPYFEVKEPEVKTTTMETELVATLNSLTKTTNSGYLYLLGENGDKRIFYRYKGDDPTKLHTIFGNYSGPVTIRCKAKLDEQLIVLSVDIFDVDRLQLDMFGDALDGGPEEDTS